MVYQAGTFFIIAPVTAIPGFIDPGDESADIARD